MNWDKIKKEHPMAWALLGQHHRENEMWADLGEPDAQGKVGRKLKPYEVRHLFDFFDEHGIRIVIEFDKEGIIDPTKWYFIAWEQDANWSNMGGDEVIYDNRTEAEVEAFEKSFEILENRLKNTNEG